jgi:hypothetical protein
MLSLLYHVVFRLDEAGQEARTGLSMNEFARRA